MSSRALLGEEAIDLFCHFLPPDYIAAVRGAATALPFMFDRACAMPAMVDLDARRRIMDEFPGYRQTPSLTSPPVEALARSPRAEELARIANDAFARIVSDDPQRFPSFVATVPMHDPEAAMAELERAVRDLGAAGIQIFTTTNGRPVDDPGTLSVIEHAARLGRPVWLHPIRPMTHADYAGEAVSRFDLWWAFGWPHETSLAMGRLVFAGVFDRYPDFNVITHHAGGTTALMAGRLGPGLDMLGTRTPPAHLDAIRTPLREKPLDAFRRFHADTATFGSAEAIACGLGFFGAGRTVFATDMPFDPEGGRGFIHSTLAALESLDLSGATREAILSGNARRLLQLPVTA